MKSSVLYNIWAPEAPNKERIQMFVDALRSGEYKQCQRTLRTSDGYCCLGVASEIYMKHAEDPENPFGIYVDMSPSVSNWYGFGSGDIYFEENSAMNMNDKDNSSFSEIADKIEAKYLKD